MVQSEYEVSRILAKTIEQLTIVDVPQRQEFAVLQLGALQHMIMSR